MKKSLLLLFLIFSFCVINAQVSKTINVITAGTLFTLLTAQEKLTITNLTVTGNINNADLNCMRDELAKLAFLDISALKISQMPYASFSYIMKGNYTLKQIILPDIITYIGDYAFAGCYSLENIIIPNGVTWIGENAFSLCASLTNVNIPNSVNHIGEGAFGDCKKLENVTIGNSVSSLAGGLFYNCQALINITIPNSVISIGESTFRSCWSLSCLTIPKSVKTIGSSAFIYCDKLSSIIACSAIPIDLSLTYDVFKGIDKTNCRLYVPTGSTIAYKNSAQWNTFVNIIETATSLQTKSFTPINICPNPIIENFKIIGLVGTAIVSFIDLNGKVLFNKQISENENVSVSNLPIGAYNVSITTKDETTLHKILKK